MRAENPRAASLGEMVRLATIPAAELLAETRSALLLVDVQNRFIYGTSEANPAPSVRILEPVKRLLASARANDVTRVFVTVGHPKGSDSAPWMRRLASMGSDVKRRLDGPLPPWANEIPAAIAPQPGEVHLMKCASARSTRPASNWCCVAQGSKPSSSAGWPAMAASSPPSSMPAHAACPAPVRGCGRRSRTDAAPRGDGFHVAQQHAQGRRNREGLERSLNSLRNIEVVHGRNE